MAKALYIAEKPSVAQEFAKALHVSGRKGDGYIESEEAVVTWCVGHLVTMSYPEVYDEKFRKWSLATLPFLPEKFLYEVIPGVSKQFNTVKNLLTRSDVDTIYVCTDSGREGEYIYRLVEQMAGVTGKMRKRVWIDSQTEEEILRGIREAKDLSAYDNLAASAYLRAKEDYLMGINFSRLLTLKYGNSIASYLNTKYTVISVGRVMTCVLGMVVRREREIREFVKTPFYRVVSRMSLTGHAIEGEFRAVEGSRYYQSPLLYKENGFKKEESAKALIGELTGADSRIPDAQVLEISRKQEKKNPPLLYNLAELQNECSKLLKISPDETLRTVQELYEKKLVTYPRTDARVLSSAVAKEISRNLNGLSRFGELGAFASEILAEGSYKGIGKSRYTNDAQITDHYAIIPTGQGLGAFAGLNAQAQRVYLMIVRRFLSIFYPPAVYQKVSLTTAIDGEKFFSGFKMLLSEGYLKVLGRRPAQEKPSEEKNAGENGSGDKASEEEENIQGDTVLQEALKKLKKGDKIPVDGLDIREGETSPPKRYNSGSMILAMENAGQLIEDEELRAQIKGSGIGTSATRAEILKKLVNIKYLSLNKKTQVLTPTQLGEMVFDVVRASIRSLLNPELTASWEKGLTYVAQGDITEDEYMGKLTHFIVSRTDGVLGLNNQYQLRACYDAVAPFYKEAYKGTGRTTRTTGRAKAAAGTSRAKAGSARGRAKKTAAE
ncbi:DNA topoisomerase [Oscillospiraceae bacterium NTUH-002-81]|nr:DNA topoisomerase [Oscillospiraceae bacterium NTUH-002-81]